MAGEPHPAMSRRSEAIWWLAEAGVVIAAAGAIAYRGAWVMAAWVGIVLPVWVALRGTIYIWSGRGGAFASFAVMTLFMGVAVGSACYRTSGRGLFAGFVADPIPESVEILRRECRGGLEKKVVFLRFRVSPEDLEGIPQQRDYEDRPRGPEPVGDSPEWWRPAALGSPAGYRWQQWRAPGWAASEAAWLWVSESGDDAYFAYWSTRR